MGPLDYVLNAYPRHLQLRQPHALGAAGGFSGARFWRVGSAAGPLCLRRWPTRQPEPARLRFIHDVVQHVADAGFAPVPVPLRTTAGETFVDGSHHLWELTPWMPGEAEMACPAPAMKIRAALTALARFHRAVESMAPVPQNAVSPGIVRRQRQLLGLISGGLEMLARTISDRPSPELAQASRLLVERFPRAAPRVASLLNAAGKRSVPIAPCLRDIWSAHVLFVEDKVTGVVDFGALRPESVAADVARLLGSMAGDDLPSWHLGLTAYQAVRPLSESERALVDAFDQSTTLLAGLNWIDWIFRQGRQFDDLQAVLARVELFAGRLRHLVGQGGH